MIGWLVNDELKDLEGSGCATILRFFPGICLEGLRKNTENLNQDSSSPDRDLNPEHPKYKAGVLTTWPRCSAYRNYNGPIRTKIKFTHQCLVDFNLKSAIKILLICFGDKTRRHIFTLCIHFKHSAERRQHNHTSCDRYHICTLHRNVTPHTVY
jgi:hypothetical protein